MKVRYQCAASRLVMAEGDRVSGIEVQSGDGAATTLDADAVDSRLAADFRAIPR